MAQATGVRVQTETCCPQKKECLEARRGWFEQKPDFERFREGQAALRAVQNQAGRQCPVKSTRHDFKIEHSLEIIHKWGRGWGAQISNRGKLLLM